ncbi:MAG: 4-(cytidine 5'-diphospho)-2-C-methyl-D-erythritol kinase [Proteobacteria bacterium]|nr:4-(cytidine 5'-diphospho)-2-C-methyl-D-erythritol kinase [Pseudomonadota bacterium]
MNAPGELLWPAPAKLNLFLHVTGRRADGYHELQTLFQLVDLADTIRVAVRANGAIERLEGPEGVAAEEDLVVRAARALQRETGVSLGAQVGVSKRIPLGGGLGGGSSDAATVLLVLNRLWDTRLTVDELARLGVSLGADVPVFIRGFTAWGDGIGERLQPVPTPQRWFLVIHPGVSIGTREIFQSPELKRDSARLTIRDFFRSGGRNDCEPVVRARYAQVAEALDWLGRFAPPRLTGTGSCVFAQFETAQQARQVAAQVPGRWRALVTQAIARSPLHELLEARAGTLRG